MLMKTCFRLKGTEMSFSKMASLTALKKAGVATGVALTLVAATALPAAAADGNVVYETHCSVTYTGFHNGSAASFIGSTRRASSGCGGNIGIKLKAGATFFPTVYTTGLYVSDDVGGQYPGYSGRHYYSGSSYFTS